MLWDTFHHFLFLFVYFCTGYQLFKVSSEKNKTLTAAPGVVLLPAWVKQNGSIISGITESASNQSRTRTEEKYGWSLDLIWWRGFDFICRNSSDFHHHCTLIHKSYPQVRAEKKLFFQSRFDWYSSLGQNPNNLPAGAILSKRLFV